MTVPARSLAACAVILSVFLADLHSQAPSAPKATSATKSPEAASGQPTGPTVASKPGATTAKKVEFVAPPSVLPSPDPELSEGCQSTLNRIRELDGRIPKSFQFLTRSIDEISADMTTCSQLCRQFLDECPGQTAELYVNRLLGRMLLALSSHVNKKVFEDLRAEGFEADELRERGAAKMGAYFAEVRKHAISALEASEESTLEHFMALLLAIDLNTQSGTSAEMKGYVETMARLYPTYPLLGEQMFKVGKAFLADRKYDEGVEYMDRIIAARRDDPWYVIFNISLFDGLQGAADLDRMLGLMNQIEKEYPKLIPTLHGIPRTQAQQWYDVSGFWRGFTKYAMGDTAGALEEFVRNEKYLSEKVGRLEAEKKSVDPVVKVYLDYRTRDYIQVINDFHGKPPTLDLELGSMWATDHKVTLENSRGKVVAVIFREPGSLRSREFYQDIDRYISAHESDGIVGVQVSYLMGSENPTRDEQSLLKMQVEMANLGINMAGGFDPDRKRHKIFHALHGTVGPSTTFVVFNRKGEFAWYLFDPRTMDRNLARKVLDRLLKE